MAILNSPASGGTVAGTGLADTITGSNANDVLIGAGGNDIISGGAGNDTIYGDGSISYAQAFATAGYVLTSYTGNVTSNTGLQLTSLGQYQGQTVWRIRNSDDATSRTVTLSSTSNGSGNGGSFSQVLTIPANSELIVLSNNMGSHRLILNGRQIDVRASTGSDFSANGIVTGMIEGEDSISGGDGDDTIDGGGGNDEIDGGNGNDTLRGGAGNDSIRGGDGDDIITGGLGDDALFGGAGNDTFLVEWSVNGDFYDGGDGIDTFRIGGEELQTYAQEIDLIAGTNNWGDRFVSIENIVGGTANDKFWGTDGVNLLQGGEGDDLLDGRGGDDRLEGQLGNDTIYGGLGADLVYGGDGDDHIDGGADNDVLYGDAGADTIFGNTGNDRLTGGAGADVLDGGDGVDTADYRRSDVGVDVSLVRGTGLFGDAEGDTLVAIENLSGSAFADILTGDDGPNRLTGMSGEDRLFGMGGNDYIATGGGYDYVDGGDGIDTVTYEDSWDRVVVNLTTGRNQYGEASRDVLVNVENIVGSAFNDTITGDAGANRLTGGDGDDALNGMGGNDYLFGNAGADTLTGGEGADVFVFNAGFGDDTISDFWAGAGRTDRIWFQGVGVASTTDVNWSAVDSAAGAVITIEGHGSLTLTGVMMSQLVADDFIFS
jgi:Ca2+-binding RTX toxin-like protein